MVIQGKPILLSFFIAILFMGRPSYSESHELRQGGVLEDGKELLSADGKFKLGFFSPRGTTKRYVGIWYNKPKERSDYINADYYFHTEEKIVPVWVANRNTPISDKSGNLTIDSTDGNLKIFRSKGDPIVISSRIQPASGNRSATLKNTGNLVLYEMTSNESVRRRVLWQSFDYPTDTLLPGMKLGKNLQTGHEWFLRSWNSSNSPANGSDSYTFGLDPNDNKSLAIWRRQNQVNWRSGLWLSKTEGFRFASGSAGVYYNFSYTSNDKQEIYFRYTVNKDVTTFPALTIDEQGYLYDDTYEDVTCPVFGGCDETYCETSEDTFQVKNVRMSVEGSKYREGVNVTDCECKEECQRRRCFAFASTTNSTTKYRTCEVWEKRPTMFGESYRYVNYGYREIYVAVRKEFPWLIIELVGALAVSLLCSVCYGIRRKYKAKEEKWWQSLLLALLAIPFLLFLSYLIGRNVKAKVQSILNRRRLLRELDDNVSISLPIFFGKEKTQQKDPSVKHELKIFDFRIIAAATDNFSTTNKLGQGGFGPVYKGILLDGQEIAIKKLSKSSGQGLLEFKNEAKLIAKLQHTNLVRLLGCSLHGSERILVYEYMPNKSLDFFIFGSRKNNMLNLKKRLSIIEGIAQGLIYLHKYSRLKVIHRDLKVSNILLDDQMNPKISDFGMARTFGVNELEANTNRIVGTHGYMPPEYVMNGIVSLKTDVYSFGVMVLEIVSSKRNNGSYDPERPLNLVGYAWRLWNQGRVLELIDQMDGSCSPKEVLRFVHVGLLCVQDLAGDRPTMSEVVSILSNDTIVLPAPKQPAFFINITFDQELQVTENKLKKCSANNLTISVMEAR